MSDSRDPSEFVRLLVEHQFRLYAFILSLVPNQADADDIMQETSMAMWEMFDRFEPGTDFGAWARTVARYRVLKYREHNGKAPIFMTPETVERVTQEAVARSDELEARRRALGQCVQKLPPRDRELLKQVYDPVNRTLRQVAETLGRPANTVYKAVTRIHDLLLNCVQRTLRTSEDESHG